MGTRVEDSELPHRVKSLAALDVPTGGPAVDQPLPRGRHGIAPAKIASHQRARVLAAAIEGFASEGFSALSVSEIVARAGISRPTFYELYENKLACVLAAQDLAIEELELGLEQVQQVDLEWSLRVAATIDSLLSFLISRPKEAGLVLPCGPVFSHPEVARRSLGVQKRIASALLAGAPETAPAAGSTSAEVLTAGLLAVAGDELRCGADEDRLARLGVELTEFFVASCGDYQSCRHPLSLGSVGKEPSGYIDSREAPLQYQGG